MRCPTCGTENAPDSRFCGGCGARLEPPRVAPTVKLHDDAPIPTPPPGAIGHLPTPPPGAMSFPHGPASIPPQNHRLASQPGYAPASIAPANNPISRPPASQPPASQPPASQPPAPRRASTPAPMSSPSLSMPMPPRRSGAMIAIVLVLDLALAAAGATLLFKGLAKPRAADARPAKTEPHAAAIAAPAPSTVASAPAAAPGIAPGSAAPAPEPPPAPEPADKTLARDPKKKGAPAKSDKTADRKTAGNGPLDPYGPPDRSDEIELHARDSFGAFRRCFEDAIQVGPVHGDVRIAFVVEPDGRVSHASPVVNTTSSDGLASCLAQTIGAWSFAPHSGAAVSYERPFNYP